MKIAVNLNWSAAGAGRDVYMDMNGWHLYLRDISAGKGLKLNQALAQQAGFSCSECLHPHHMPADLTIAIVCQHLSLKTMHMNLA